MSSPLVVVHKADGLHIPDRWGRAEVDPRLVERLASLEPNEVGSDGLVYPNYPTVKSRTALLRYHIQRQDSQLAVRFRTKREVDGFRWYCRVFRLPSSPLRRPRRPK